MDVKDNVVDGPRLVVPDAVAKVAVVEIDDEDEDEDEFDTSSTAKDTKPLGHK